MPLRRENSMIRSAFKRLLVWVLEQGGDVSRDAYRDKGVELGCPPPGQNAAFGTMYPSMIRVGDRRVLTEIGRERVARYRAAA